MASACLCFCSENYSSISTARSARAARAHPSAHASTPGTWRSRRLATVARESRPQAAAKSTVCSCNCSSSSAASRSIASKSVRPPASRQAAPQVELVCKRCASFGGAAAAPTALGSRSPLWLLGPNRHPPHHRVSVAQTRSLLCLAVAVAVAGPCPSLLPHPKWPTPSSPPPPPPAQSHRGCCRFRFVQFASAARLQLHPVARIPFINAASCASLPSTCSFSIPPPAHPPVNRPAPLSSRTSGWHPSSRRNVGHGVRLPSPQALLISLSHPQRSGHLRSRLPPSRQASRISAQGFVPESSYTRRLSAVLDLHCQSRCTQPRSTPRLVISRTYGCLHPHSASLSPAFARLTAPLAKLFMLCHRHLPPPPLPFSIPRPRVTRHLG